MSDVIDPVAAEHYIGWAEEQAGILPDVAAVSARTVKVVGVGTMGIGIAIALLSAGFRVTLVDQDAAAALRWATDIGALAKADLGREPSTALQSLALTDRPLPPAS